MSDASTDRSPALTAVPATTAHATWSTLEALHGLVYFAADADEIYGEVGLEGRSGYFASRSAALGAVPWEVVVATFFNFNPELVERSLDGVWERTTPVDVLQARLQVIDRALRGALGDAVDGPEIVEAADLARRAAEHACSDIVGRPLFAAHVALPWPTEAHLVLWHAQTLLREHRGDGHLAALVTEGLDGIGALVSHAASGAVLARVLQRSRGWSDDAWNEAVESLRHRGLLTGDDDLTFTPEGAAHRQRIEDATNARSAHVYEPLGEEGCERLRELARPLSRAAARAFVMPAAFG